MSERQFLIHWLSQVAGRLRLIRRLHALGTVTLWLLGIVTLYEILRALISQPQVVQALTPLLVLSALGAVGYGVFRMARVTSLTEAASVADQAANLSDQLKSAYWFAHTPTDQPAVELLLQRASRTAHQRDPRQILPLQIPGSAWGSVALALIIGALTWWSPQLAYSIKEGGGESKAVAMRGGKQAATSSSVVAHNDAGEAAQDAAMMRGTKLANGPLSAHASESSAEEGESKGSTDERTGEADSQPAPAGASAASGSAAPGKGSGQNAQAESPSEWLGSVLSRLKDMMQQGREQSPGDDLAAEGEALAGARMSPAENGRNSDAGARNPTPEYRNADRGGGSDMRMNSLGGIGPRNTLAGEGTGEEQSGRNNSNSGAMGQRVGTSRGGAGDEGDAPRGNPGGESESAPVLGRKTQRLAMQLKKVPTQSRSTPGAAAEDEGTPEAFFSATRSQASRVDLEHVEGAPRAVRNDALRSEQTPLAYRTVVKDYFLTQHRKEK